MRTKISKKAKAAKRALFTKNAAYIVVVMLLCAMFSGQVYNMVESTIPLISIGQRIYFFMIGLHQQTSVESLIAFILFVAAFSSLYLMYDSTKKAYQPRISNYMLFIGLVIFVTSFFMLYVVMNWKLQPPM